MRAFAFGGLPLRPAASRAARASTASRTVAGTRSPPAASTSVTKNGFPWVFAKTSGSAPEGAHSSPTAE